MKPKPFHILRKYALCHLLPLCAALGLLCACGEQTNGKTESTIPGVVQEIASEPSTRIPSGDTESVSETYGTDPAGESPEQGTDIPEPTAEPEPEASHIESVPALSLYRYDGSTGNYNRLEVFESAWTSGQDIVVLAPFASDEDSLYAGANAGTRFMDAWNGCWYAADPENPCKIGFQISFPLTDGTEFRCYVLHPGEELAYRSYLENYLYDDIHQTPGAWYSHLEPSQENDATIFSSIKFTAGSDIRSVDGAITVTVFAYRPAGGDAPSPDFDSEGEYIGDRSYTVVLRKS